ncbi:MAG: phospho-N-acetylmuramoyl-pentapeptide-transferase [Planctomycetota bacterium]|nr:phospho-N-acetylmuramoyl-pentapeptide-transferase [Planctomycetota bacterium]
MIVWLHSMQWLGHYSLFGYQTFRMVLAAVAAFLISVLFTQYLVKRFRKARLFENQSEHEEPEHIKKMIQKGEIPKPEEKPSDVATMGGIAIVTGILVSVLITCDLSSRLVTGALVATSLMALIGFADDFVKMRKGKGISSILKLLLQLLAAAWVLAFLYMPNGPTPDMTELWLPLDKDLVIQLGGMYAILFILFTVGSANAVNVTDGIDGLSAGLMAIACLALAVVAYVAGRQDYSEYLYIAYVPDAGEIAIVLCATTGACLGFLWHNASPASIYMGDTGSLALGATFAYCGLVVKQEFVALIIGAVFLIELVSVAIQICMIRCFGKRYFGIAPIHIVFQKIGWKDTHIVTRAYIIGIFLAMLALGSMKIR